MLGHGSAAMTVDVYTDWFDDDLDSFSDALDHAVSQSNVPRARPNPYPRAKQKALFPFVYKGNRAFSIRGDGGI